jgi:hypothetical protein
MDLKHADERKGKKRPEKIKWHKRRITIVDERRTKLKDDAAVADFATSGARNCFELMTCEKQKEGNEVINSKKSILEFSIKMSQISKKTSKIFNNFDKKNI